MYLWTKNTELFAQHLKWCKAVTDILLILYKNSTKIYIKTLQTVTKKNNFELDKMYVFEMKIVLNKKV